MNTVTQDVVLKTLPADPDRRRYLGGSDAAAVMGVGAYEQTRLSCYLKKIGDVREEMDPERKRFLERRKRWEGPIVEMLREEFDGEIVAVNQRYVDPEFDFMAAELDFEWRDPADGSIQNGEIKTVSPFAFGEHHGWGDPGTSDIPIHYAAQVMHGLMVTGSMGRRTTLVAAMIGLDNMVFYRVDRDEETIAAMRQAEVDFWHNHVLARVPPEPQTLADIKRLYTMRNGRPVELTHEIAQKISELAQVRAALKSYAMDEEEIAFEVQAYICQQWGVADVNSPPNDNAILMLDGKQFASWKRQRGAYLDQKRLAVEKPDISKEYTVEHHFRVLRITKPKQ